MALFKPLKKQFFAHLHHLTFLPSHGADPPPFFETLLHARLSDSEAFGAVVGVVMERFKSLRSRTKTVKTQDMKYPL